ncbi:MAG: hypothetical protein V5A68_05720 [Candidatus Thermoplasmatota archaeon]
MKDRTDKKIVDTSDLIAVSGFLLVLTIIALWCLDISVSALLNGGYLTNGFLFSNPYQLYHVALYIVILVAFSNFLIILHILIKNIKEKNKLSK